jgi:hypothetical protein
MHRTWYSWNLRRLALAISLLLGLLPWTAAAQCRQPEPRDVAVLLSKIRTEVAAMEEARSPRRGGPPALVVRVKPEIEAPTAGTGVPNEVRRKVLQFVGRNPCPNSSQFERTLRAAGRDLTFAVGDQFQDLLTALERVDRLGPANIDAETRNVLKLREVNYLVYVSLHHLLERRECSYPLFLGAEVDIVSVEAGTVRSATLARLGSALTGDSDDEPLAIHVAEDDEEGRLEIALDAGALPVCLGRATAFVENLAVRRVRQWTENVGCLGPGESYTIQIPEGSSLPRKGSICVEDEANECRICSDEISLASGLPSGAWTTNCGCWGYVNAGARRPNPECSSGYEAAVACPAYCMGGGYAWGVQCL